jgi:hypothetical protein
VIEEHKAEQEQQRAIDEQRRALEEQRREMEDRRTRTLLEDWPKSLREHIRALPNNERHQLLDSVKTYRKKANIKKPLVYTGWFFFGTIVGGAICIPPAIYVALIWFTYASFRDPEASTFRRITSVSITAYFVIALCAIMGSLIGYLGMAYFQMDGTR